jgi:hypothetical protein
MNLDNSPDLVTREFRAVVLAGPGNQSVLSVSPGYVAHYYLEGYRH